MKKVVSVILVAVLICLCSISAFAEGAAQARYTGIMTFTCSLSTSGVLVKTSAGLSVWSGYTSKATAELQEKGSDGVWRTVANYEASGTAATTCVIDESYIGFPGRSYRAYCVFRAYDAGGNEVDCEGRYTSLKEV